MTRRLALCFLAATLPAGLAGADCLALSGEKILAKDLAPHVPAFAAVEPGMVIGYAPNPGATRVFTPGQLNRLLARYGAEAVAKDPVCVELAASPLMPDTVREALLETLGNPDASLEIVELSAHPVPAGKLRFQPGGLYRPPSATPETAVLWRGVVEYGERRTVAVWARVRVSVRERQVIAKRALRAGEEIQEQDIELRTVAAFPHSQRPLNDLRPAIGARLRRSVAAGDPIPANSIILPEAVERGDTVTVLVRAGAARLRFEAKAETSGPVGAQVYVRNPTSGQRFTATVEDTGKVIVEAGSGQGES